VTRGARPEGLHEAGAYRAATPRLAGIAAPVLRHFDRRRLKLIGAALWDSARARAPWRGPGGSEAPRLLDIGAGRGRFVASARAAGYDAEGLEPTDRGVQAAREAYGVSLRRGAIEDAELLDHEWQVICLWHVLEHTEDPDAVLARVARALASGGVLIVGVPNLASIQARLGGARWFHLDLPRHRTHFTPAGLHALVARHGLVTQRTVHLLAEHNAFGMWQTLVSRLTPTPSYLYHLLKRNVSVRAVDLLITALGLALAPASAGLELAAGVAGRGGTIALLATLPPAQAGGPPTPPL
jgi:SAM-dependent methyltransferase